ncbi:unnamed protein product, partial [Scytosiphon promiscuus]
MENSDEDAWGDFKSTPEPIASAEAPVPVESKDKEPRDSGEGSELSGADPSSPSDHHHHDQQQLAAAVVQPAEDDEGEQAGAGGPGTNGVGLPQSSPTAAAAEDAVELIPGTMTPMMSAGLPQQQQLSPPQDGGGGAGASIDLLGMLPSPTAVASRDNLVGDGGDGNTDFFGAMLSSPVQNAEEITGAGNALGAAASDAIAGAAAPDPLQHDDAGGSTLEVNADNEKADDEKIEGGWGLLEQPETATAPITMATETAETPTTVAPAATETEADATTPPELDFGLQGDEAGAVEAPLAEATSPPAEKVDGEWIDLAAPASVPQDGDGHDGDSPDDGTSTRGDKDGAGETLATSDRGVMAVGRGEGEEPPLLSDGVAETKCISPTTDLYGENDGLSPGRPDDETGKQELLPVVSVRAAAAVPAGAEESSTRAAHDEDFSAVPSQATEVRITEAEGSEVFAEPVAGPDIEDATEEPAVEEPEAARDGGLLEPAPAVFIPQEEAGGEPGEGVGPEVAGVETESTPLPDVAAQPLSAAPGASDRASDLAEQGANAAVPAANVFDWGDFGGATGGTVEVEEAAAAVAAPSESLGGSGDTGRHGRLGEEEDGEANGGGQREEEDEWSAFAAPPNPSPAETQQEAPSTPAQLDEAGVPAAESVPNDPGSAAQEFESDDGRPEPVPPASADQVDRSGRSELPDGGKGAENEYVDTVVTVTSADSGDAWGSFGQAEASSASPTDGATELAGGEWGAFGQAEASSATPAGEAAERVEGVDGGASTGGGRPASDDGPGKAPADQTDNDGDTPPPVVPELGGGDGGEEVSSSSWGAFDEAPLAAGAVTAAPPGEAATTAEGATPAEEAEEFSAESREVPADELSRDNAGGEQGEDGSAVERAAGDGAGAAEKKERAVARAEAGTAEAEAGAQAKDGEIGDVGGDEETAEAEDEDDDWGSDFGDFEEAPVPEEDPEQPTGTADTPDTAATAAVKSPEMDAVPQPPVSAVRSSPGTTGSGEGIGVAVMEGGVLDATRFSTMSVASVSAAVAGSENDSLLAVMVAVFDAAFHHRGLAAGGTESTQEDSLDSLADLAYLLRHTQPSRRCREPPRLTEWATRCILGGIHPVPDALPLGDADDQSSGLGGPSRRSGGGRSVRLRATTTAAAAPPASSRAVSPSSAPRRAPSSPVAAARTTSSRVVSPSPAPPPLRSPPESEKKSSSATGSEAAAGTKALFTPEFKSDGAGAGVQEEAEVEEEEAGASLTPAAEAQKSGTPATPTFASFPSTAPADPAPAADQKPPLPPLPTPEAEEEESEEDDGFVWSEAVSEVTPPEMPRQAPPREPLTASSAVTTEDETGSAGAEGGSSEDVAGGDSDKEMGVGFDGTTPRPADGGDDAGAAVENSAVEAAAGDDGGDWSDDPFDSFQSAPAAAPFSSPPLAPTPLAPRGPAVPSAGPSAVEERIPSPPQSSWNLDFLMAAPSAGVGGGGRSSPLLGGESA